MNGGSKMQFNNNISIESIIFIVIILVLIWYIFRLYKEIQKLRHENVWINKLLDISQSNENMKRGFILSIKKENNYMKYKEKQLEKLNG